MKIGTDNSMVDAQNKTGAAVTANPGVKHWVAWGCNDEKRDRRGDRPRQRRRFRRQHDRRRPRRVPHCKDWQAGQTTGNKAALFISGHDVGSAAVKALVTSIRDNKPLPAKTVANTTIVDPANWKSVMGSCS